MTKKTQFEIDEEIIARNEKVEIKKLKLTKIDEFNYDAGGKPAPERVAKEDMRSGNSANYDLLSAVRLEYLETFVPKEPDVIEEAKTKKKGSK